MKFDLKGFRKTAADKDSTTMTHYEGHSIKISHRALGAKMREKLAALPLKEQKEMAAKAQAAPAQPLKEEVKSFGKKSAEYHQQPDEQRPHQDINKPFMAEGGEITDAEAAQAEAAQADPAAFEAYNRAPASAAAPTGAMGATGMPSPAAYPGISEGSSPIEAPQARMDSMQPRPAQMMSAPAPQAAPGDPATSLQDLAGGNLQAGYGKQMTGIEQAGQAEAAAAQATADTAKQAAAQQQQQMEVFKKHYTELDSERKAFQADVAANHIDPSHYMSSLSGGDKMMTAIGLILGGAGAGVTGGPNPAMTFLNQQIDRDIKAQEFNLNKKENLLNANMRQFGNMKDATDMTRVMLTDITANKLRAAALKSGDVAAQARANQAAGALEMSVAPQFMQLALRRTLTSGDPAIKHTDPAMYVPYIVPKEQQTHVYKEISDAQNIARNHDEIMKQFDIAASHPGKMLGLGEGAVSQSRMSVLLMPILRDQEGKVSEFESGQIAKLLPTTGDRDVTIAAKRRGMEEFLLNKRSAPVAKSYNIDLSKFSSTSTDQSLRMSPQEQSYLDWAKKNPQDPRSSAIIKKLGVH